MSHVTQLGYLGLNVSDLARWEAFALDILGLQLAAREPGQRLALRMDDYSQRWLIEQGTTDDLTFSGWETASQADLETLVIRLTTNGVAVTKATHEEAAARKVDHLYVCHDPDGNRVELYAGPAVTSAPFRSPALTSAFVTGGQGLGHFFLIAQSDRQILLDFYVGLLGIKISDYIREEIAPGIIADAAFLHCNGRHHTLAIARMPIPKRIHHLMIQVSNIEDLGFARDRCRAAGIAVEMDIGMHPNDKILSFYAVTPSGFSVEIGWGGIQIDDATWSVRAFDKLSEWGHHRTAA